LLVVKEAGEAVVIAGRRRMLPASPCSATRSGGIVRANGLHESIVLVSVAKSFFNYAIFVSYVTLYF
jgi:hypothetical protein